MSELERNLVERFHEALNSASAKKGELDSQIKNVNEAYAQRAVSFFLESTVQKGNKFYLNCPKLTLPKTDFSGIQIGNLFATGGQHYIFEGKIENFDSIYLAPFYVELRKHQIRAERGGKIDSVRQNYAAEAEDELEYFIKQNDFTTIKNKIIPLLKSKFRNGKCVIRIPKYLRANEEDESDFVRLIKDNIKRSSALDGLVHDHLLFSAGRYANPLGREIQVVERVRDLVEPATIYRTFNLVEIAKLTKQTLEALIVLDELGVVHRDIKPDNIFVSRGQRMINAKLSDFDMMKITPDGREHGVSSTQTVIPVVKGTPRYYSPEHNLSLDSSNLDVQSDICSLGLTVYKWWTGYHAIYVDRNWSRTDKGAYIPQRLERKTGEEAIERSNPPVYPLKIESRASYNGEKTFFKSKQGRLFEENFVAILSKMIDTEKILRYKTPYEVISDIDLALEGVVLNIGFNPYKNFGSSRRDVSTSKSRPLINN